MLAVLAGVFSSCFAFGLDAGEPIRKLTLAAGTGPLSLGLPVLCVVLAGGFTTNFLCCLAMIIRNRAGGEFTGRPRASAADNAKAPPTPLLRNYALCALYLDSHEPANTAQAARSNHPRTDHLLVRYSDSGGNRARFAVETRRDNVESAW